MASKRTRAKLTTDASPCPEFAGVEENVADARLWSIFEDLEIRARNGEPIDIDLVARLHPDLAVEIRRLWPVASVVRELGSAETTIELPRPVPDLGAPVSEATQESGVIAPRLPSFFGDYELLEEIGRGGMGVVYRARQRSLDRPVALKMILGGGFASREDLARFRAEAEIAARIDHPNAVKVYEAGEIGGQPYFTMQLIDGTSLAERLREGRIPAREAAKLLVPVCRAVHAAHGVGLLHRDLKPANILIDRDGRPYVADFGLAKRTEKTGAMTQSGAIVGTPRYMSPEQASGNLSLITPASDVYSLGTILYELLTGRPPFIADAPLDVVLAVRGEDPPLPRTLVPQVDRELEMVALKCLQKPADLRYSSAEALANDLESWLEGGPVSARSGTLIDVMARLFRETYHAAILENWGLLWMWHAVVLFALCFATHVIRAHGVTNAWPYLGLWSVGLGTWAGIFWALRRRGGPVTFVERQIAHMWAGGVISCSGLFVVEMLLRLPVLTLSPVLGLVSGSVFLAKASILSGRFYVQALALYATAVVMALAPESGLIIFGSVSAACFFLPGWRYYRSVRSEESRGARWIRTRRRSSGSTSS